MKILIKNLHNQSFTVQCEENNTIKELKEIIAAQKTIDEKYDPELIKLLCTGKVMDDEDLVNAYTIKDDGHLVLVKQLPGKPKPPPKKKPNQGYNQMGAFGGFGGMGGMSPSGFGAIGPSGLGGMGPGGFGGMGPGGFGGMNAGGFGGMSAGGFGGMGAGGYGGMGAGGVIPNSAQQGPSSQITHQTTGNSNAFGDTPEAFTTEDDRRDALDTLLSMGFDKATAEKALRASYYNLETAIEYITSNAIPHIPDTPAMVKPIAHGNPPASQPVPQSGGGGGGIGGMTANLQQMREMLQKNPEKLQLLKQTIQAEHPEIAQMIDDDPQGFLDLLNQASAGDESQPPVSTGSSGTSGGAGGQNRNAATVTLSASEQESITRLQDMGFDRNRVIEAFLACDRNENLAANYLLSAFD